MQFSEFNLDDRLMQGLNDLQYVECTPVQEAVLKAALDGSALYVQSQTGTGKTCAYLASILQEILSKGISSTRGKVLILLPTRELAVQVEQEASSLAAHTGLKTFSFYGGVGYEKQLSALKKGVDIVVGTPGRMIDLNEGHQLDLSGVEYLVIDEADRMFDMGFYPDLRTLLKALPVPEARQTMLFSATLNTYVKNLAWEFTRDAKEITIEAENITVDQIDQELLHVSSDDKMRLLIGVLTQEKPESVLIFCNTKKTCEIVSKRLGLNGLKSEFIIGDLPQQRRLAVLNRFKAGDVHILVATDVAARGIDVHDLAMVVNYDLPNEAENYVHRIGRTARAGKSGKAYTFCSEQDVYNLPAIERYIEMSIPSRVADEGLMAEDKSRGVYIRTEDWGQDRDDERGGRYERGSKIGRRDDRRDGRKGNRDNRRGGAKRDRNDYRTAKTGDRPYSKAGRRDETGGEAARKQQSNDGRMERPSRSAASEQSSAALSAMPFEERMKFYKGKYAKTGGKGASPYKKGKRKADPSQASGTSMAAAKGSKTGGRDAAPAPLGTVKKPAAQVKQAEPAKTGEKSLFAKLKGMFSKRGE